MRREPNAWDRPRGPDGYRHSERRHSINGAWLLITPVLVSETPTGSQQQSESARAARACFPVGTKLLLELRLASGSRPLQHLRHSRGSYHLIPPHEQPKGDHLQCHLDQDRELVDVA